MEWNYGAWRLVGQHTDQLSVWCYFDHNLYFLCQLSTTRAVFSLCTGSVTRGFQATLGGLLRNGLRLTYFKDEHHGKENEKIQKANEEVIGQPIAFRLKARRKVGFFICASDID